MGNTQSNAAEQPEPNSESIERYYAALRDDYQGRTGAPSSQCADSDVRQPRLSTYGNQVDAPNTESSATNNGHTDSMDSMINISRLHSLRDAPYRAGSMGDFDRATVYLAQAVTFTSAARDHSIQMLKKIDLKIVAKAILEWIKAHLYETAAIVVPLLLLACTPGLLGLLGFGTTGIAAGSIAAGIHAGLGNVAAGSLFAVLTSAGMGGFGVPIVLGGVWTVSSVVGWGIAAWKRWCGDKREESDEAQIQRLIKEYGGGDADGDMI